MNDPKGIYEPTRRIIEDPSLWILGFLAVGISLALSRLAYVRNFQLTLRIGGILGARQSSKDIYDVDLLEPQLVAFYSGYALLAFWLLDFGGFIIYPGWKIFAVVLVYPFVKFVYISMFSSLFNIWGFSSIHFIDFFRLGGLMMLSLFLVVQAGLQLGLWQSTVETIRIFLIGIIVLRTFILYLKLITQAPFSKLHLFFYLCTTEILPLFFTAKSLSS